MNENFNFDKVFEEVLNSATLSEVEEYGCCVFGEEYTNDIGQEIKILINELYGKTYLLRYVDKKCVQFRDITAFKN